MKHEFRNNKLLRLALTHPSLRGQPNYERLEFLGDSIISMVVSDMLFEAFPNDDEGRLAIRRSSLVNRNSMAKIAVELGLDKQMHMDRGEEKEGGRSNPSNLEDVLEAYVAAVYKDAGIEAVIDFVRSIWGPKIEGDINAEPLKDSKTQLQEILQKAGLGLPTYQVIEHIGDPHKPQFKVALTVADMPQVQATGRSKRQAEQAAATIMLERLKL